jgi:prepilin-type processing-associated H-X9-DG protein
MKQIGLGIAQYTQDYDERFPIILDYNDSFNAVENAYDTGIMPYIKSQQLFVCPSDTVERVNVLGAPSGYPKRSYSVVAVTVGSGWQGGAGKNYNLGRSMVEVTDTSRTLAVAEKPFKWNIVSVANQADVGKPVGGDGQAEGATNGGVDTPSHLEGWNYLFCDGHVKWYRPQQTVGPAGNLTSPQGMWTIAEND